MNIFKIIDLKNGVLSNVDACVRLDLKLELQKDNLVQDIVQIYFNNKIFIDIGWYPTEFEITKKSFFLVRVCSDGNWDNLIYEKKCESIEKLVAIIEEAIIFTNQFQKV